jgi:hypothetical protein
VAGVVPPTERLTGSMLHMDAGMDGQWSAPADLDCNRQAGKLVGLLLGVTAVVDPTALFGPNGLLKYGGGWATSSVWDRRPERTMLTGSEGPGAEAVSVARRTVGRDDQEGFVADHHRDAQHHAHLAAEGLEEITDPAQRASVNAMLALTHALLSAGEDARGLHQPLLELQDTIRYGS